MSNLVLARAWSAAWAEFLQNKVALAERRGAPWLSERLETADADALLMLADLAHICGAVREDMAVLRQALAAYDAHLALTPSSQAGLRMRAETLLRLKEYRAAFDAFTLLHRTTLDDASAREEEEVSPFRLLHDAECIEDAVQLGAEPTSLETSRVSGERTLIKKALQLSDVRSACGRRHGASWRWDCLRQTPRRATHYVACLCVASLPSSASSWAHATGCRCPCRPHHMLMRKPRCGPEPRANGTPCSASTHQSGAS